MKKKCKVKFFLMTATLMSLAPGAHKLAPELLHSSHTGRVERLLAPCALAHQPTSMWLSANAPHICHLSVEGCWNGRISPPRSPAMI